MPFDFAFLHDAEPDDFEYLYQLFIIGRISVHPLNEDIERTYRGLIPHVPTACPHGKTRLTCAECNLTDGGWKR